MAMPGEGTTMITQPHHSIDESLSPHITQKHEFLAKILSCCQIGEDGGAQDSALCLNPTVGELLDGLDSHSWQTPFRV